MARIHFLASQEGRLTCLADNPMTPFAYSPTLMSAGQNRPNSFAQHFGVLFASRETAHILTALRLAFEPGASPGFRFVYR